MDGKRLKKYLLITFLITWICWWLEALLVKVTPLRQSDVFPMMLFVLGGFGPTIAGLICMKNGFSWKNLKEVLFPNTKRNWLIISIVIIVETTVFLIPSNGLIDAIPRSPIAIVVAMVVFLQAGLIFGGNEEIGWRVTMLPILEEKFAPPLATLFVGVVWVSWHLPLWFIEGDSHQGMPFLGFAALGLALSYWLSMVYDLTGGVLFCMILHGWTNTLLGLVDIKKGPLYYILMFAITGLAMAISIRAKRKSQVM